MATIQKRKNKNGTTSYRVMIRPDDGLPAQYKTLPTHQEAKDWAIQEEAKRRQGLYFPEKHKQKHTLAELIERYCQMLCPEAMCAPLKQISMPLVLLLPHPYILPRK